MNEITIIIITYKSEKLVNKFIKESLQLSKLL